MTLREHVIAIRAAIKAARDDGYRVVLEDGDDYREAYVDLEAHDVHGVVVDWDLIVGSFD